MLSGFSAALSGIHAGGRILGVTAHNIANAQTEEFKRTRALPEESAAGGVTVTLTQDLRPGPAIFDPQDPLTYREGSNVDLGEEIVTTLQTTHLIEANVASLRTQDRMLGSLLDILE